MRYTLISAPFLLALLSAPARADIQIPNAAWSPFPALCDHVVAPDSCRAAYFDSYSWKGPNQNIGYFILGEAGSAPWLSAVGGGPPTDFHFVSPTGADVDLLKSLGGWATGNSLGWYSPDSSAWGWLFRADGQNPTVPSSASIPGGAFGLFFVPNVPNPGRDAPAYYTDSALNQLTADDVAYAQQQHTALSPEAGLQHFAVFADGTGGYYVGIEDRSLQIGDGDYGDMVVHIAPVPEAASLALLFTAALLVALTGRFRRAVRGRDRC